MAIGGRYVPNPAFVPELERSQDLIEPLKEQAGRVKEAAESIAHSELDTDGGYYASDLHADRVGVDGGKVAVYVDAGNFKAHWIEWGSIHNVARHIIQRAVDLCGFQMRGD